MHRLATRFGMTGANGRRRAVALVAGLIVLSVIPASMVFANHTFSDVPTSAFYHDSVTAIRNAGITAGCTSTKYCPGSNVTRGQMAVFLDKLGALSDDTVPVVDALSVNGHFIQGEIEQNPDNPGTTGIVLLGGAPTECETVDAGENDFNTYSVVYQLFDTPGGIEPEEVNVQIRDNPATPTDQVWDLCFATIDGTNLIAGTYQLYFQFTVFIGQGIFGAGASPSSHSPARAGR